MVHKFLTPGIDEMTYKERRDKVKLGIADDNPDYGATIFQTLQSISPVKGTIRSHKRHVDAIKANLSYSGRDSLDDIQLEQQAVILNLLTSGTIYN